MVRPYPTKHNRKGTPFLWILLLLSLPFVVLLSSSCESAFAPEEEKEDGDFLEDENEVDLDEAADSDEDAIDEEEEARQYNLRITPEYGRQGSTITNGEITFDNEAAIRAKLSTGNPSLQSYQVSFGDNVEFELVRFDAEGLRFHDIKAIILATARTGEREIWVRITYGDVSVIEYGRFYVLPPREERR